MVKNKTIIFSVLTIVIIILIVFGYYYSIENEFEHGETVIDFQVIYYPTVNSTIQVNELGLDNQSIQNINNDTFSITINSPETNRTGTYNLSLNDNELVINFDDYNLRPRLSMGIIEEKINYSLEFVFNINSDDADIQNLTIWGNSNIIQAEVGYNSTNGLVFFYKDNYSDTSWHLSDHPEIILTFPHNINFGIYVGITCDF